MASCIVSRHPLSVADRDSALMMQLETEDPFLMSLDRLVELIEATSAGELRGYLVGILDARRLVAYIRPDWRF